LFSRRNQTVRVILIILNTDMTEINQLLTIEKKVPSLRQPTTWRAALASHGRAPLIINGAATEDALRYTISTDEELDNFAKRHINEANFKSTFGKKFTVLKVERLDNSNHAYDRLADATTCWIINTAERGSGASFTFRADYIMEPALNSFTGCKSSKISRQRSIHTIITFRRLAIADAGKRPRYNLVEAVEELTDANRQL